MAKRLMITRRQLLAGAAALPLLPLLPKLAKARSAQEDIMAKLIAQTPVDTGRCREEWIDGVVVKPGDRVIYLGQTQASENGVYVVENLTATAIRLRRS